MSFRSTKRYQSPQSPPIIPITPSSLIIPITLITQSNPIIPITLISLITLITPSPPITLSSPMLRPMHSCLFSSFFTKNADISAFFCFFQ